MGKLAVFLGSVPVLAVEISGATTTRLGRSTDSEIVLPLPEVADHHAEVEVTGESCRIRALPGEVLRYRGRSVNRIQLSPGDEIGLGGYRLLWLAVATQPDSASVLDLTGRRSHGTKPLEPPPASARPVTRIDEVTGTGKGLSFLLEATMTLVGRSPECDLVLKDDSVSWQHCSLELSREGIRVRDLDSHNGTFLDGRRIESALAGAGSRIRLGQTTLKLISEPEGLEVDGLAELVGGSPAMQEVYAHIRDTAGSRLPVLVTGETGTGKELVARAVHSVGPRSAGPFVPVNCAAIPREMLEDELFGHVKGAFTGATSDRQGAFERADSGTIFLDEIGQLAADVQAKLLRVLEDGEIPRLGGNLVHSDFRVVAATNSDLGRATSAGEFRRDLFFRLAGIHIRVPPLRERPEDLPDLVRHFVGLAEAEGGVEGGEMVSFGREAMNRLGQHDWPGNVRELRNVVFRAVAAANDKQVEEPLIERLITDSGLHAPSREAEPTTLEQMEADLIRRTLSDCGGQKRAAARRLGIAESTLYEKIRRYRLR